MAASPATDFRASLDRERAAAQPHNCRRSSACLGVRRKLPGDGEYIATDRPRRPLLWPFSTVDMAGASPPRKSDTRSPDFTCKASANHHCAVRRWRYWSHCLTVARDRFPNCENALPFSRNRPCGTSSRTTSRPDHCPGSNTIDREVMGDDRGRIRTPPIVQQHYLGRVSSVMFDPGYRNHGPFRTAYEISVFPQRCPAGLATLPPQTPTVFVARAHFSDRP